MFYFFYRGRLCQSHHACAWKDYTGNEWFLSQGFTPLEFDLLVKWSAWAHTLTGYRTSPGTNTVTGAVADSGNAMINPTGDTAVVTIASDEHAVAAPCSSLSQALGLNYLELGLLGRMTKRVSMKVECSFCGVWEWMCIKLIIVTANCLQKMYLFLRK